MYIVYEKENIRELIYRVRDEASGECGQLKLEQNRMEIRGTEASAAGKIEYYAFQLVFYINSLTCILPIFPVAEASVSAHHTEQVGMRY